VARFYTDEDIPSILVRLLFDSNQRHNVRTTRNLDKQGDSDADQLLTATGQQRILLTHNESDFLLLHTAWLRWPRHWIVVPSPVHAGIITISQQRRYPFNLMIDELDRLVSSVHTFANQMYRWHYTADGVWRWEQRLTDYKRWELPS